MFKIHGFTDNGHAIVDAKGRFRVVIHPAGDIAEELLEEYEATAFCEVYNNCRKGKQWAEAVPYSAVASEMAAV